jgi:YD repeat-containing protein
MGLLYWSLDTEHTVMKTNYAVLLMMAAALPAVASAEQVTYRYDALGRMVKVVVSGGPAAGVDKTYQYDKAGNRQLVVVSGSQNSGQ